MPCHESVFLLPWFLSIYTAYTLLLIAWFVRLGRFTIQLWSWGIYAIIHTLASFMQKKYAIFFSVGFYPFLIWWKKEGIESPPPKKQIANLYCELMPILQVDCFIPKHYLPPIVRLCGKLEMLDRLLPKLKATNHRVWFPNVQKTKGRKERSWMHRILNCGS